MTDKNGKNITIGSKVEGHLNGHGAMFTGEVVSVDENSGECGINIVSVRAHSTHLEIIEEKTEAEKPAGSEEAGAEDKGDGGQSSD